MTFLCSNLGLLGEEEGRPQHRGDPVLRPVGSCLRSPALKDLEAGKP